MSKIYTRTGDKGRTSTFMGEMSKSDMVAEVLGAVDELNSWVGFCRTECGKFSSQCGKIDAELRGVQRNLLVIGSGLAGSGLRLGAGEVRKLERSIDAMTADLPKLRNFILPTGEGPAACLQVARTVARRAERRIVAAKIGEKNVLKYLNRLSDALFTMARWVNWKLGGNEEVWEGI